MWRVLRVFARLDKTGDEKITLDVAMKLCKIDSTKYDIVQDIAISANNIVLAPSCPYVIDADGGFVIIPVKLYSTIVDLIKGED